ncbi:outer membrane beta-barrel protein [Rhodoligotrophos defluvii]|uniref:outer membrane beta-barrel protein n=1 Tax=Rhodoligotrophos defluvii TaxID=2561934 RepID=UPI0010C9C5B0|nr:outer membrane beta-barrel protein [Rhodoligotrophos defluvii]
MNPGAPAAARRRGTAIRSCLGAAALIAVCAWPNQAQAADVMTTEAYEPLGIDVGGLTLYPSLEIGGVYTDNVRQSRTDRRSDVGLRLKPIFEARSDWNRHGLEVHAESEHVLYAKESRQNIDNADIGATYRLDIRRDFTAEFEARYELQQEGLAQPDIPVNALDPRKDETYRIRAGLTYDAGRIAATIRGGTSWYRFGDVRLSDGSVQVNKDLNYTAPLAELRVKYQDAPILTPYIEAAYVPRIYDRPDDELGVKRSSDGARFAIGAEFEPSPIWRGMAALTYEIRDYRHLARKMVEGVGFDANVIWRPRQITAVTLDASSGIGETNVTGATATRDFTVGLRVDHAFRYNLIAAAMARYTLEDYIGIKLTEQTWSAGLDVSYFLTPRLAVIGSYEFTDYTLTGRTRDYTENRVMVGVKLQQ